MTTNPGRTDFLGAIRESRRSLDQDASAARHSCWAAPAGGIVWDRAPAVAAAGQDRCPLRKSVEPGLARAEGWPGSWRRPSAPPVRNRARGRGTTRRARRPPLQVPRRRGSSASLGRRAQTGGTQSERSPWVPPTRTCRAMREWASRRPHQSSLDLSISSQLLGKQSEGGARRFGWRRCSPPEALGLAGRCYPQCEAKLGVLCRGTDPRGTWHRRYRVRCSWIRARCTMASMGAMVVSGKRVMRTL